MERDSPSADLAVTYWGAALSVTGSMHLVTAAGRKILLDCGSVRGPRFAARHAPFDFPFAPAAIDAVVLSHAHMDHCGNLPQLVHQGFTGPIYCTPATRDLIALMLADSARIQDEDAFVQDVIEHAVVPPVPRTSRREEVQRTLGQCVAVPYNQPYAIDRNIQLRLVNAGHLLGSAMVAFTVTGGGRERRLTFTGDLGRRESTLLDPPAPLPPGDLVISECTYGDRVVDSLAHAAVRLAQVVRTTVERGGKVLIPAFSLGRTQVVVDCLVENIQQGRMPPIPIFVDSPLAAAIVRVYQRYPDYLKADAGARLQRAEAAVHYVHTTEESQELTTRREPCVIVAPGGMCEGGRIVRHLKHHVDDPRCSVVLVSYQAPHSLGRRLLLPGPRVRIHGRPYNRWADFLELSGFSGHPDQNELVASLLSLAGKPCQVRLVHGEAEQGTALAHLLRKQGLADVSLAVYGETTVIP